MKLLLIDRFNWLKNNKPPVYNDMCGLTWEEHVETNIKAEMYLFWFNHPFYGGYSGITDDEARHCLLDDLNVPRTN